MLYCFDPQCYIALSQSTDPARCEGAVAHPSYGGQRSYGKVREGRSDQPPVPRTGDAHFGSARSVLAVARVAEMDGDLSLVICILYISGGALNEFLPP